MASEEVLEGKKAVFDERKGTTHWPVCHFTLLQEDIADMDRIKT